LLLLKFHLEICFLVIEFHCPVEKRATMAA
jgi:hypothetical protein